MIVKKIENLIIDINIGNLKSVKKMFDYLGINAEISSSISDILLAERLILPGVGNFKQGMENIIGLGLLDTIRDQALQKAKPILGICLGMQLLTNFSEEGNQYGLGIVNATTRKFIFENRDLKIPHMGWNNIVVMKKTNMSLALNNSSKFYFVHSYYVECEKEEDVLFSTNYGSEFVSGFQKDNIIGVQFHPEKSHKFGMQLLKNFCNL